MIYIGTQKQCKAYNSKVTEGQGYSDNVTINWAKIRKHPTKNLYAIVKHKDYESDMELVESLSKDWFPKEEQ